MFVGLFVLFVCLSGAAFSRNDLALRRFDLKGSRLGRRASDKERANGARYGLLWAQWPLPPTPGRFCLLRLAGVFRYSRHSRQG